MLNLNLNTISTILGAPAAGPTPPPIPVVNFSASTTGPNAGDTVDFTDLSTNSPNSWLWSFPGGTPSSSTLQNPKITYGSTGSYDVTLQAGNTGGTGSLTKSNYINVQAAWTPADFNNVVYWWNTSYGVTESGGAITAWQDELLGETLTNSGGSGMTYTATDPQFNNQPSLYQDTTKSTLVNSGLTSYIWPDPYVDYCQIYIVKPETSSGWAIVGGNTAISGAGELIAAQGTTSVSNEYGAYTFASGTGTVIDSGLPIKNELAYLLVQKTAAGNIEIKVSKDTIFKSFALGGRVIDSNPYKIELGGYTNSLKPKGYILEAIYIDGIPSNAELTNLATYINNKYGPLNDPCPSTLISTTDLWSYYKFDTGGTGLTHDYSGQGYTLTNNGVGATAGIFSGGANFDGTGYMTSATDLGLEPFLGSVGWTLATWVSLNDLTQSQTIYHKRRVSPSPQGTKVRLDPQLGAILVTMTGYSMNFTYPVGKFVDDSWHHVAVTWDGSNVRCYVDGVNTGTTARSTYNNATTIPLNIGRDEVNNNQYLDGRLEEYIIYRNRDIGATDIAALAAGTCPLTNP